MAKRNRKSRKTNRLSSPAALPVQPQARALPAAPQALASDQPPATVAQKPAVAHLPGWSEDVVRVPRILEVGEHPSPQCVQCASQAPKGPAADRSSQREDEPRAQGRAEELRAQRPANGPGADGTRATRKREDAVQRAAKRCGAGLDDVAETFFQTGVGAGAPPAHAADSFPPWAEDVAERVPKGIPRLADVLVRRARFRRLVGGVVLLSALVVLGGVVRTLVVENAASAAAQDQPAPVELLAELTTGQGVRPPAIEPTALHVANAPAPRAVLAAEPPAAVAPRTPTQPLSAGPEALGKLDPGGDPRAEALRRLNSGKMREAVPLARAAIQADPTHAIPYLYLGTALQELGERAEAMAAYDACVRTAARGPIWECRAMGGRK
jgi:hypothetical protein